MGNTFSLETTTVAHDGAGEGICDGVPVRVFGMLPGEEAVVEVNKKRGIFIGSMKQLLRTSPSRKNPEETHYLSCSPWQVAEYPLQAALKRGILEELFGFYPDAPKVEFVPAQKFYGYRTKIEFSFCDQDGAGNSLPLSLAFHERGGGKRRLQLPEGCLLASEGMNRAALEIVKRLREQGYAARDLKTLVLRESKSTGKLLALLYAKKETVPQFAVDDISNLSGFIAFHSTERSPASVATKELWRWGSDNLIERIGGFDIEYSWDAFFQNNIPIFEEAMGRIKKAIPQGASVLELYAGVGTIGLLLAKEAKKVHGIEIIQGATDAAKKNAAQNKVSNYVAECIPAEKMDARLLDGKDVLVLDPPRAGLHPKVIGMIKEKLPPKIIYLSCNPETQARDYSVIRDCYKVDAVTGFDFYPQTPHLESLLLLTRISK